MDRKQKLSECEISQEKSEKSLESVTLDNFLKESIDVCFNAAGNLSEEDIFNIANVFNTSQNEPIVEKKNECYEKHEALKTNIKIKLLKLFESEGLHEQNNLSEQRLKTLCNHIWEHYQKKIHKTEKEIKCEYEEYENVDKYLKPSFESIDEGINFHLNLFNWFKSSEFCSLNNKNLTKSGSTEVMEEEKMNEQHINLAKTCTEIKGNESMFLKPSANQGSLDNRKIENEIQVEKYEEYEENHCRFNREEYYLRRPMMPLMEEMYECPELYYPEQYPEFLEFQPSQPQHIGFGFYPYGIPNKRRKLNPEEFPLYQHELMRLSQPMYMMNNRPDQSELFQEDVHIRKRFNPDDIISRQNIYDHYEPYSWNYRIPGRTYANTESMEKERADERRNYEIKKRRRMMMMDYHYNPVHYINYPEPDYPIQCYESFQTDNYCYNEQSQLNQNFPKSREAQLRAMAEFSQNQYKSIVSTFYNDEEKSLKKMENKFLDCRCNGKINESGALEFFECHKCKSLYHYSCIYKPKPKNSDNTKTLICPCCQLKRTNCLETMVGPFSCKWYTLVGKANSTENVQKLELVLSESETKQISSYLSNHSELKEKHITFELKFLRMIKDSENANSNQENQAPSTNPLIKNMYNSLKLPFEFIINIKPGVEITTEIKPNKNPSPSESENLLFFFLCIIIRKNSQEKAEEMFKGISNLQLYEHPTAEQVSELPADLNQINPFEKLFASRMNFIENFFTSGTERKTSELQASAKAFPESEILIKIFLYDKFSRMPIKYPMRGNRCKHAEVFDCEQYLSIWCDIQEEMMKAKKPFSKNINQENDYFEAENQDVNFIEEPINCPFCDAKIDFFVLDRFLYFEIQALGLKFAKLIEPVLVIKKVEKPKPKAENSTSLPRNKETEQKNKKYLQEQEFLRNSKQYDIEIIDEFEIKRLNFDSEDDDEDDLIDEKWLKQLNNENDEK